MELTSKERNRRIAFLAAVAAALLGYAVIVNITGFRVPCLFHQVTGLDCPGCGITRMCVHAMQFDLGRAFSDNGLALVTSPLILFIVGCTAAKYVGVSVPGKLEKVNTWIAAALIAAFVLFGIARNIAGPAL